MSEIKIRDDRHSIPKKRGNGVLRREVWADQNGNITRYSLAFINLSISIGDNGRVLGYDNQHGYHHRHFMGNVEPVGFISFEELENHFDKEWTLLLSKIKETAH